MNYKYIFALIKIANVFILRAEILLIFYKNLVNFTEVKEEITLR